MVEKTFNPIVKEESYKNGLSPIIPTPGPKCAALLIASSVKGHPLILYSDTPVSRRDIRKGRYDQLVEIDLHSHNICIKEEVLSDDFVSKFTVAIAATANVKEPDLVYEEQAKDIAQLMEDNLLTQIQDTASEFSIKDSIALKRVLKDSIGSVFYLESGINISNVNVTVQVDDQYAQLLTDKRNLAYNTELEQEKAKAAGVMKDLYSDNITAVFSQFAVGDITAEEALKRSKAGLSQDFDERMRQIREVTDYIKGLERDEMVKRGDMLNNVKALLNSVVSTVPDTNQIETQNTEELPGETNPYEPIDDADDEE